MSPREESSSCSGMCIGIGNWGGGCWSMSDGSGQREATKSKDRTLDLKPPLLSVSISSPASLSSDPLSFSIQRQQLGSAYVEAVGSVCFDGKVECIQAVVVLDVGIGTRLKQHLESLHGAGECSG